MTKSALKEWLRKVKAVENLYRRLLVPENDASWIFDRDHLAWTRESSLSSQLPPAYRALARFYAAQIRGKNAPVLGGQLAFRMARAVHSMAGRPTESRILLGDFCAYVNLRDMRMWQIPNELLRDDTDSAIVERVLKPGDSFVDVGGNHGSFSLRAGRVVGKAGRVVTFEPQPVLARLIRQSMQESAPCEFEVIEQACGREPGRLPLFIPDTNSGSASLKGSHGSRTQCTVRIDRLDSSFDWHSLPGQPFLKIDVEGAEADVIYGATEFLKARHPPIFMEINPTALGPAKTSFAEIKSLFDQCGYTHALEQTDLRKTGVPIATLEPNEHRNVLVYAEQSPLARTLD